MHVLSSYSLVSIWPAHEKSLIFINRNAAPDSHSEPFNNNYRISIRSINEKIMQIFGVTWDI